LDAIDATSTGVPSMTATTIDINGVAHYRVGIAARVLRTTPAKIRALMGDGTLEWNQARVNGPILVTVESVRKFLREQVAKVR
jgi:hypothetical protein